MSDETTTDAEVDQTPPVPGADNGPQDEEGTVELIDDLVPVEDYVDEEK